MFSILKDWNIKHARSKKFGGQCTIHPKKKQSTIYLWNHKARMPKDYLFHEYLHVAIRALSRVDRRKPKEYRRAEETLIQEICKIKLTRR